MLKKAALKLYDKENMKKIRYRMLCKKKTGKLYQEVARKKQYSLETKKLIVSRN